MLEKVDIKSYEISSACVIWLHGLGADGFDFEPVVKMLNLPHIHFILPHAPHKKITMNNGYEMRAWYDLFGLDANTPQDATGIEQTRQEIHQLIEYANQSIPIFMAHGIMDEVIRLETSLQSRKTLEENGFKVDWHEYAMPHSVNLEEIEDIRLFLNHILP